MKVNLVQIPGLFDKNATLPVLKSEIGDKQVTMLMDSGADISVIARDLLPRDYVQCLPVHAKGFGSGPAPKLCQTATFQAEIDGKQVQLQHQDRN